MGLVVCKVGKQRSDASTRKKSMEGAKGRRDGDVPTDRVGSGAGEKGRPSSAPPGGNEEEGVDEGQRHSRRRRREDSMEVDKEGRQGGKKAGWGKSEGANGGTTVEDCLACNAQYLRGIDGHRCLCGGPICPGCAGASPCLRCL